MAIGLDEEHAELAHAFGRWAEGLGAPEVVRAAEQTPDERFEKTWAAVREMGLPGIAVPEPAGGGGTLLDLAVALEAAAGALVPGPLLGTSLAAIVTGDEAFASGERTAAVALGEAAWDGPSATDVLARRDGSWVVRRIGTVRAGLSPDLSRRVGTLTSDDDGMPVAVDDATVTALLTTLAAAEASGVAAWCLRTAVEYAKVREQFGRPIGAFQAIKHLCAELLETSEAVTAAAWDAARAYDAGDLEQFHYAADVAGSVCLDGAVEVAKGCVQVLGGIGFTFEHDAHLYLRRALALRLVLGPTSSYAARLARRAVTGQRRRASLDLGPVADERAAIRAEVGAIAARPEAERRLPLAESGLLAPHWPAPYGRDATPVTQLLIDEELAHAGIGRPDLKIGGWAAPTILAHGTHDQRERFVPATLRGEIVWCQLFSEPGAGSDLASLRTRAVRVEGGWRLTGQKVWTSLAHQADWGICLARTDPDAPQHKGISYFLVDMRSEGIDIRPLREITGEAMFNEVFLDEVFVPDECLVGEENGGWRLAVTTLANERVAMSSTRLDGSVETAVELLSMTEDPVLAVEVGRRVADATVVALLGQRTTLRSLAGQGPGAESSVAKLLGVRVRQDSAELVVDMLGERIALGDDLAREALHQQLLTRCLSIAGGTTQVLRNVAGERILGLPRG